MSQKSNISISELRLEDEKLEELRNNYQNLIGNPEKTKNISTKKGKQEQEKMRKDFFEMHTFPLREHVKSLLIEEYGEIKGQVYIEKKEKNGDLDKYVNNILKEEWKKIITQQQKEKKEELHKIEKRRQSHVSEIQRALLSHTPSPEENHVPKHTSNRFPPPKYEVSRRQPRRRGGNKTHKKKSKK